MEPEEEEDQTDQVVTSALEMLRKLLFTFFRLPPSMRNVVCHRVTGMTWKQIGLRYSVSLQAAEKKFRAACKIMPELAMMFPKQATGRRKTVGLK